MALFTENEARARAQKEIKSRGYAKDSTQIIVESVRAYSSYRAYDIFLSHSVRDAELILGMKGIFEDMDYSVYVDWVDDPQLDRSYVSSHTAEKLRQRMKTSKSLFYVTTDNSYHSKWMPWECGYFDGLKDKVAIVPVKSYSTSNQYSGQEYLGLYPYCVRQDNTQGTSMLWIRKQNNTYLSYDVWVETPNNQLEWRDG